MLKLPNIFHRGKSKEKKQLNIVVLAEWDDTDEDLIKQVKAIIKKTPANDFFNCDISVLPFHSFDRECINEPDNVHEIGLSGFEPETVFSSEQEEIDQILDTYTLPVLLIRSGYSSDVSENERYAELYLAKRKVYLTSFHLDYLENYLSHGIYLHKFFK